MAGSGAKPNNAAPFVSVIMPAYNAAATLEASANSVLSQKLSELELIIVDDGSIDGTQSVCRRLEKKDERVRVISTANSGPAAARNTGLNAAAGEFVTFVDSDDLILPEMLSVMLEAARETGAGAVVCGASIEYPKGGGTDSEIRFGAQGLFEGEELKKLFDLPQMTIFFSGWGKLYRRDVIEEHGIRMDIAYRITEDTDFAMRYMENCSSVYLVDECFYRYLQVNSASLTSVRNAEALKEAAYNIAERQNALMLKWGMEPEEAERRSREYLYSQLNAAAFIKLRSGARHKDKKAFYKSVISADGLKGCLRRGKFSSRVLAAGFAPALLYTKLHGVYMKLKSK